MMPIWSTAPVGIEPEILLIAWAVIQTEPERGEHHFLGFRPDIASARISSAITAFDRRAMQGLTSTGRSYQLVGPPGVTLDSQYLLLNWCRRHGIEQISDVTNEYLPELPSSINGAGALQ
ncbi:hypothetical protein VOM14_19005 [Paraburkholderia sp. MPAMCS5]|uniref:hypothetical protein n=1 Tax=Paraburkholderia sp. MPAMCS5 TaxID=3112563 RepID=UPI002E1757DD|nr:hypothetical protein [Paraburkholderia sp. MPAMCS5]